MRRVKNQSATARSLSVGLPPDSTRIIRCDDNFVWIVGEAAFGVTDGTSHPRQPFRLGGCWAFRCLGLGATRSAVRSSATTAPHQAQEFPSVVAFDAR